ncbi:uncharacterized protein LOC133920357 [Phragmites australis]|uniref:uncharacterized protein LOC133920357 n=1 Tax=Phragmites australis TaxID=29695 RepID=UPI002D77FA4F|nr:uncharacterized protein LOC133920357 [Phragmites australis]
MELVTPPPPQDFVFDGALGSTNPFASTDDAAAGNPFFSAAVTAPPSPNPFEHLPPGASDVDPFDLFQHFTSAPASPARAAAIYAQFDSVDGGGRGDDKADDDGFQPRVSYSTVASTVPFDWEEKPGKPKPEFASATAMTADGGEVDDTDFDFGVLLDKAAQTQELTTADELFDEGKIRPLKPPPRLLDGGSVGSSPRSARSAIWSPRLRSLVGPGSADFDPFAAALAKAAKAPSPLGAGGKDDAGGIESASSPKKPDSATSPASTPPATNNGGRKKWRLSDLLLFRRASAKGRATGNISKDPVFKYWPVQQLGQPIKKASAGSVSTNGDVSAGKRKKQSKKAAASAAPEDSMPMPHRQSVMGCVRLHPGLHRLAKGFNGHSAHLGGPSTTRSAMKG